MFECDPELIVLTLCKLEKRNNKFRRVYLCNRDSVGRVANLQSAGCRFNSRP